MGYKSFEDLEVYKAAREYRKKMYKLAKELPPEEKFNLSDQMRRAGLSLTNNIAEGHGRYHFQENIQFCRISRGWVTCLSEKSSADQMEELLIFITPHILKPRALQ